MDKETIALWLCEIWDIEQGPGLDNWDRDFFGEWVLDLHPHVFGQAYQIGKGDFMDANENALDAVLRESRASNKLRDAAPELLAALYEVKNWLQSYHPRAKRPPCIDAAIAKAEGRD